MYTKDEDREQSSRKTHGDATPTYMQQRILCLDHATDLATAAERVFADDQAYPNIAYHLAILAMEEIGKAGMLASLAIAGNVLNRRLVTFEISSPTYYRRRLSHPTWPGVDSGVTVGIGYDLGMAHGSDARSDWGQYVDSASLDRLMAAVGVLGARAKALAAGLADITIALEAAETVFYQRSLPLAAQATRTLYLGVDRLPPDAQSMLLSLVYNRFTSTTGPRRVEMFNLKALIAAPSPQDLQAIALQFESMVRLWPDSRGLRNRRIAEATMIRAADHPFAVNDVITV